MRVLILFLIFISGCANFEQAARQVGRDYPYTYRSWKGYSGRMEANLYCQEEAIRRMSEKNAVYESTRVALTLDCMRRLGWL